MEAVALRQVEGARELTLDGILQTPELAGPFATLARQYAEAIRLERSVPGTARDGEHLTVRVVDRRVFVAGACLDLTRRATMLRLFVAFTQARDRALTRRELVERIYDVPNLDLRSRRYVATSMSNTVKMLSRARSLAHEAFREALLDRYEWFVYDHADDRWHMCRQRFAALRVLDA
jgi:hypothetical protein